MDKNGLFLMSIGMFLMMFSGSGNEGNSNHTLLFVGVLTVGVGAWMSFGKKKKGSDKEKKDEK